MRIQMTPSADLVVASLIGMAATAASAVFITYPLDFGSYCSACSELTDPGPGFSSIQCAEVTGRDPVSGCTITESDANGNGRLDTLLVFCNSGSGVAT